MDIVQALVTKEDTIHLLINDKTKNRNMNIFSSFVNILLNFLYLICILFLVTLFGCYSFTGGAVPEYLKTINIATINDNSGYGNPKYREVLATYLIDKFRNDNTLQLTESGGDARLNVTITSIKDETITVNPGEVETERKISVACEAEYYDSVNKKIIWKKNFSNFEVYKLSDVLEGRDKGIQTALEQTSDDILLAVVSGW